MRFNLIELYNELLDQRYELVPDTNLMVIDYDNVITAIKNLEKELRTMLIDFPKNLSPPDTVPELIKEILGE